MCNDFKDMLSMVQHWRMTGEPLGVLIKEDGSLQLVWLSPPPTITGNAIILTIGEDKHKQMGWDEYETRQDN